MLCICVCAAVCIACIDWLQEKADRHRLDYQKRIMQQNKDAARLRHLKEHQEMLEKNERLRQQQHAKQQEFERTMVRNGVQSLPPLPTPLHPL